MPTIGRPARYLDFEIELKGSSRATRKYNVSVLTSPDGSAGTGQLRLPFDSKQLSRVMGRLEKAVIQGGLRHETRLRTFGSQLFNQLFKGEVRDCWITNWPSVQSRRGRPRLRLKLRINSPVLAGLPWELLFDSSESDFMSLNRQIAIVRYAAIPLPDQSRSFSLPLRVLAAAASPSDLSAIDIESERRSVDQAMAKLAGRQRVKVQWLMNPSWKDVQTAVWKEYPHVFYFVGHGDYDPRRYPEGVIALVNPDDGTKLPVSASDLARLVNDYALRLVVLNSCKGARGDRKSLFSSSAGKLVRSGVPAVLAMQFPVTEPAGAEFSSAFYRCLAAEDPIESALAEARLAMKGAYADSLEFGSPVLYMRSKDGRLFMVRRNFPRLRRSSRPPEDAAHVPAERSKSQRPTQNPLERGLVRGGVVKPALGRMALDCSELLGMQPRQVRASIFFLGVDGALRMSRPLSHNMHREQEFSLRIKPGQGVTGECFQTGRPLLTRFVNTPDPHATLGPQKADVHPDLKWIISVPLPTEDPAVVVSLDGLMPDGTVPTQRELKRALAGLANWIGLITREVGVVLSRRNEGGQNAKRARTVTRRKRGGGHSAKR